MTVTGDITSDDGGGVVLSGEVVISWTDLAALTDSVRNVVARPGTFTDLFPETTDDHLITVLADALAEAHMMGLLLDNQADDGYLVRPPLPSGAQALVVLYAGVRLIRAELFNRVTSAKYVAGPVSAETSYATNILRDIMAALQEQKDTVYKLLVAGGPAVNAFLMADSYHINALPWHSPNGVGVIDWFQPGC